MKHFLKSRCKRPAKVPAVAGDYTALKLTTPAPIPSKPHSIGMWVRGDSSWGRKGESK